jgi:hypothetical protein
VIACIRTAAGAAIVLLAISAAAWSEETVVAPQEAAAASKEAPAADAKKEPAVQVDRAKSFIALQIPAKAAKAQAAPAAKVEKRVAPVQLFLQGAVNINAAAGPNNANQALVQQFAMQFQPLLQSELEFARQICGDLPIEQRVKIKAAGDASLQEAAQQMANMQQPQQIQARRVAAAKPVDAAKIIREGLSKSIQETVAEDIAAQYVEAATRRREQHKRAAIMVALSRLDATLCLTDEQRRSIAESLTAKWEDKWDSWLMLGIYGGQYMPQVPDEHLRCLSADQKEVWRGTQQIDLGFVHFHMNGQPPVDDGWWAGEKPQPAPQQAVPLFERVRQFMQGIEK